MHFALVYLLELSWPRIQARMENRFFLFSYVYHVIYVFGLFMNLSLLLQENVLHIFLKVSFSFFQIR